MMEARQARLRAMAQVEDVRADIQALSESLDGLDLWRPAAGLRKSCDEALRMIDQLAERFDRKLVVTLVGPSGAGKSTLLSALAGDDQLSPAGRQRPTTRQVVVFCREAGDAGQLVEQLGSENIRVHASKAAETLENVILIDTPDTDSTQQDLHIPIIHKAITLSDVLICVFDAENPKRRDHTDFLAPYVRLFSGESLIVAVNKCDRLDETELSETIMPEFSRYIADAWPVKPAEVLCVSARSHLSDPGWNEHVRPRHDRDQFETLRRLIVTTFNRDGFSVDRRLENARSLKTWLEKALRDEARQEVPHLSAAMERMAATEAEALQAALTAFQGQESGAAAGINVRLYQHLAQRWLGPVGWLVTIWARILVFGTGLASLLRFGNPVRQVFGAVSVIKQYGESKKELDDAHRGSGTGVALSRYAGIVGRKWPDIAELLIRARFVASVRELGQAPGEGDALGEHFSRVWQEALEQELVRTGGRLSGGLLQLVFNLPVLAILTYAGWLTATDFFKGTILSGDFFLHAFWTIVLVLLLSFFLLQGVIRLAAGKERMAGRVFKCVQESVGRQEQLSQSPIWRQARTILGWAGPEKAWPKTLPEQRNPNPPES